MYLKDRENAELLGMTHPQYMAVKYQAESLIHATGDESDHSYGNLYDPSEYLKDYCALAMHRETWDEDLMLRSSKDYSKIVTQISLKRQDLVELTRQIPWPEIKNAGRINFMKPGQKSCKSFELCSHRNKHAFRPLYDRILRIMRKAEDFRPGDFNAITVNFNEQGQLHVDSNNEGESYGFAVGNYQKGGRIVQSKDDKVKLYNGPITQKGKFSSTTGKCPT